MSTKVIAIWGTFDGRLHPGHLHFLKSCTAYGNVVAFLTHDDQIRHNKHREPIYSQNIRKDNLLKTGYVQDVVLGGVDEEENKQLTVDCKPDVYIFTEDQTSPWNKDLERRLKKEGVKIIRLKRYKPELYSTTKIYFGVTKPDPHPPQ
jgi:glycerol-3-phosphate cytidylyltransferase-like family protein